MSYEDYIRHLEDSGYGEERIQQLTRQEVVHPDRLYVNDEETRRLLIIAGQGGSY